MRSGHKGGEEGKEGEGRGVEEGGVVMRPLNVFLFFCL